MSQKRWRKGDFRELKSKTFPRSLRPWRSFWKSVPSYLRSAPGTNISLNNSNKELLATDPNLKQIKFSSHSFISTVRLLKFISESPHKPSRLS